MAIQQVAVIGAGTMGNGIAHVFAQNNFQVSLIDISQPALDKAVASITKNLNRMAAKAAITDEQRDITLQHIKCYTSIEACGNSDLVIEAATENEEIKLKIFKQLDAICTSQTILASNTSSISITKIGAATNRPSQVIGMHFMNPVPVMKLVEIIKGYATSNEVLQQIMDVSHQLGKIPVEVNDYPGFVANKILMPMINEAIYTLYEGVAGVQEIDTVMKLGMAHPMGPLQLADFIGLDVCLAILKVLHSGFGNPKYSPCPLLVNMVNAGYLGAKSGEGFYLHTAGTKEITVSNRFK